jgi:hypothetical protein
MTRAFCDWIPERHAGRQTILAGFEEVSFYIHNPARLPSQKDRHKMRGITVSAAACSRSRFSIIRQTFQLEVHEISRNFAAVEL